VFDWRPKLLGNGTLVMHHGNVQVTYPMEAAIKELVAWLGANGTGVEDLAVLGVTDCEGGEGDACTQAVAKLLSSLNVTFIQDCAKMKGLTASDAFKLAALPSGGSLLAMNSCWEENYDPSVVCSGFDKNQTHHHVYTCYNNSLTKAFPLERMWTYLDKVSAAGPPVDGKMYTHQAIWQESTDSVIIGELHNSSLLLDETWSRLNYLVADRIQSGALDSKHINMVEVNNICDGGLNLLSVLRGLV